MPLPSLPRRHLLAALVLAAAAPMAQAWADKNMRMIVPAPAGGTMDVVARLLAEQLSTDLGHAVIVDNKPGAGGAIAVQAMNAAPADGLTIMVTASNVLTEIPHVMKTAFDPLKDVRPVATVARSGMVLVVAPELPVTDLKSLIAYAKGQPGKLSFASYSAGTSSQYAGMMLNQKAGLDLAHVPFAGSPPALQQVMGGQIAVMFDGMVTSLPQVRGGKLKAVAVATKARSPLLPDVPTMAELGYPDFDFSNWVGVVVSSAVPTETVERIHAAVVAAAGVPRVRDRFAAAGFETAASPSPAQLAQSVRAEHERNAALVKAYAIKLSH